MNVTNLDQVTFGVVDLAAGRRFWNDCPTSTGPKIFLTGTQSGKPRNAISTACL